MITLVTREDLTPTFTSKDSHSIKNGKKIKNKKYILLFNEVLLGVLGPKSRKFETIFTTSSNHLNN